MSKIFIGCLGNFIKMFYCYYSYAELVASLITCMPVNFIAHAIVAVNCVLQQVLLGL